MKKKYFVYVFGCQMNQADAERLESVLRASGYEKTDQEPEADLIAVVACSVRQSAINRINGFLGLWQKRRDAGQLKTILTGCVLAKDKKIFERRFDLVLPITAIGRLPKLLGRKEKLALGEYLAIKPEFNSKFQAYVPIMTGCNNFCAYCVVPYVRGREVSRPASTIIRECRDLIKKGYKEITLLGQNVNSYHSDFLPLPEGEVGGGGRKSIYNFTKLLKKIDGIPGDYWLRFATSHPKDLSDDLIRAMADGKHITPYLHLAAQSGDAKILKAMNRKYTPAHFLNLIKKAKQAIPGLMVSTDIIVGFPGETKAQFLNTVQLLKKAEFEMAYIAEYSPRPGTAAAKLIDNVPKKEKIRRREALNTILAQVILRQNKKYLGQEVRVLVEGVKNKDCFGKTNAFKTVFFPGDKKLIGRFVQVKIKKIGIWALFGERV